MALASSRALRASFEGEMSGKEKSGKRLSKKKSKHAGGRSKGVENKNNRISFDQRNSFAMQGDRQTKAAEYTKQYLKLNELELYHDSFIRLDNIINLFFFSYDKLTRSSLNCARLWVGVMDVRTVMVNAMTHIADKDTYARVGYRDLRNEERTNYVNYADIIVARAVQYLVTFTKHSEEEWRFLRKGFLSQLAEQLMNELIGVARSWSEFISRAYGLAKTTEKAYFAHLEQEGDRARRVFGSVQKRTHIGDNDKKFQASFQNLKIDLLKNREVLMKAQGERLEAKSKKIQDFLPKNFPPQLLVFVKNDMKKLRILVNTIQDIEGIDTLRPNDMIQDENRDDETRDVVILINDFISMDPETANELKKDEEIWPHQKGLPDLGPFTLVPLDKPNEYFKFKEETDSDRACYELKSDYTRVQGLTHFSGRKGMATKATEIPYTPKVRKALTIPEKATTFRWFFPISAPEATAEQMTATLAETGKNSPLHVICMFGGFAYFDQKGTLLGVRGVVFGDDLFFDGPYLIQDSTFANRLEKKEVFMENVTLAPLLALKAVKFGWVGAMEDLQCFRLKNSKSFGAKSNNAFKGAFFYQYDNSENTSWDGDDLGVGARRNYFQVLDFEELNLKREKNSNTPVRQRLRYVVERHKFDWEEEDSAKAQASEAPASCGCW